MLSEQQLVSWLLDSNESNASPCFSFQQSSDWIQALFQSDSREPSSVDTSDPFMINDAPLPLQSMHLDEWFAPLDFNSVCSHRRSLYIPRKPAVSRTRTKIIKHAAGRPSSHALVPLYPPPHAFTLYRQDMDSKLLQDFKANDEVFQHAGSSQASKMTRFIADKWRREPRHVKQKYKMDAKLLAQEYAAYSLRSK